MRREYWYHEECLPDVAKRTSKSPLHEICAACGYEGTCVSAFLESNPDQRRIEDGRRGSVNYTVPTEKQIEPLPVEEPKTEKKEADEPEPEPEEVAESTPEIIEEDEEDDNEVDTEDTVEAVHEEVQSEDAVPVENEEPEEKVSEKEAEIARLKAELAELEKE